MVRICFPRRFLRLGIKRYLNGYKTKFSESKLIVFTVDTRWVRPSLVNLVTNKGSRDICSPMNRINGSITSTKSSRDQHNGTRKAQSGKKNTKSVVWVLGGVGAHR